MSKSYQEMSYQEQLRWQAVTSADGALVNRFFYVETIMTLPLSEHREAELRRRLRLQNWCDGVSLPNLPAAAEALKQRLEEVPGFSSEESTRYTYMSMFGAQTQTGGMACVASSWAPPWRLGEVARVSLEASYRANHSGFPQRWDGSIVALPSGVTLADLAAAGAI